MDLCLFLQVLPGGNDFSHGAGFLDGFCVFVAFVVLEVDDGLLETGATDGDGGADGLFSGLVDVLREVKLNLPSASSFVSLASGFIMTLVRKWDDS